MYRIFVVLCSLVCFFYSVHAQPKAPQTNSKSQIDSLSRLFDTAKDAASKVKVMVTAPQNIEEYYKKTSQIVNLYNKAIKLAESIGDKKSTTKLLIAVAYLELYVNTDEPKAFKLYTKALTYAEEVKDYESASIGCYNLAAINEHQNFRAEMYKYFFKAIKYNQETTNFYYRPYRWVITFLLEDNRIDDALNISQQAVGHVDRNAASAEFKVLAYGYYYTVLKRISSRKQEADIYKQKIISLLRNVKSLSESNSFDSFATVCYEVEQYKHAIFFANQFFEQKNGDNQRESAKIHIYEILSSSYERLGDYQKSLEYYKKYSTTYLNVLKNVFSLESGRKVIRAEGEQNLLLKEKEIEKEKLYRNISFAIAFSIIILGGFAHEWSEESSSDYFIFIPDFLFGYLV